MWVALALCAALLYPAHAEDEEQDDLQENTLTGAKAAPAVSVPDAALDATFLNRPYEASSYRAAEALRSDVKLLDATRLAVEQIYARDYKSAKKALDTLAKDWPTTGIGPLGMAIVYQALMFENFDYRYERQYKLAFEQARAQVAVGAAQPGDDAFEQFVLAGALGLDAIHTMRKGEYLSALNRAFEGMKALDRVKALAPAFPDVWVGDGLYLYWRTVVTQNSKVLPDFPDKRAEGLAVLEKAEREAFLLGPGATLAIAYAFIEERQLKAALERCNRARIAYPENVINNMTLGRIYTSLRRYGDALAIYDEVLAHVPDNQRVHYHRGVVLSRLGRHADAERAYKTYLGFKDPTPDARGQAWYRLGALYARQKQPDKARAHYQQAVATSGHAGARRALEKLEAE